MLLSLFALAGCDQVSDTLNSWLWGIEHSVAVISSAPVRLSAEPVRFDLREPVKVVGATFAVCLSLRGNIDLASSDAMDSELRSILGGAEVTVLATTDSGKTVALTQATPAWSSSGKVEKSKELSACMRSSAGSKLPEGTRISRLEITSTAPFEVRGVYWESTNLGEQDLESSTLRR